MAEKWIVLKFGGTSVAGRRQWERIAALANARTAEGYRVLLVCSAVSGVTNELNALASQPGPTLREQAFLEKHRSLASDLGIEEREWLPAAQAELAQCLQDLVRDPGPSGRASLLAMGEWLSTRIGFLFLKRHMEVSWVDVREVLSSEPEENLSPARQWLSAACTAGADPDLARRWSDLNPVLITQGFIVASPEGKTVLLGRGGSDTSAALLAGRLAAERLEIWTDVPGLFSADPRRLKGARLLCEVDYAEALEMAASGVKVVHARCIRAAAETLTPVVVRDINRQSVAGTRIGQEPSGETGIKAVTCQENMAVILMQNLDARFQVGFLAEVFDIFRKRGVSIDLVATSETTTTVAINCEANHLGIKELIQLTNDLELKCKLTLFTNCICVNLVGRGARTAFSRLQNVMRYFDDRALLMVSQSANDLCLSLLVEAGDHQSLLQAAHAALIPAAGVESEGIFGPDWDQIQQLSG